MATTHIKLAGWEAVIVINKGVSSIEFESNLERKALTAEELKTSEDDHWDEHTSAMDGFEAVVLALACEGFDLNEPKMKEALQSALDAIANFTCN
jgi:hypothetical protein